MRSPVISVASEVFSRLVLTRMTRSRGNPGLAPAGHPASGVFKRRRVDEEDALCATSGPRARVVDVVVGRHGDLEAALLDPRQPPDALQRLVRGVGRKLVPRDAERVVEHLQVVPPVHGRIPIVCCAPCRVPRVWFLPPRCMRGRAAERAAKKSGLSRTLGLRDHGGGNTNSMEKALGDDVRGLERRVARAGEETERLLALVGEHLRRQRDRAQKLSGEADVLLALVDRMPPGDDRASLARRLVAAGEAADAALAALASFGLGASADFRHDASAKGGRP